jgi:hypothetical protein
MNTSNDEQEETNNMESPKQQTTGCGSGCGCHSSASGTPCKTRWIISAIVLIAAGVLVVRAMNKKDGTSAQQPAAFASPVATSAATDGNAPAISVDSTPRPAQTSVGTLIGAFSELDTAAANIDAVFVYLPGKEAASGTAPSTTMQAAAHTIESQGTKCGLFTLKPGSPDYDKLAGQISAPAVVALVKGKGRSTVTGEITESKLVQGYVAAAAAGGCSGGGCGSGGCK